MKKKYLLLIMPLSLLILLYYPFPPITSIEGLRDNYQPDEMIDFTFNVYGCGKDCGIWHVDFKVKETEQILANWHYANGDSPIPRLFNAHSFSSTYRASSNPPIIEIPGEYTIVVFFDKEPIFEQVITIEEK